MNNKKEIIALACAIAAIIGSSALLISMQVKASNNETSLIVNTPIGTYHQGDFINISVVCSTTTYVKAWECKLKFNESVLNAIQVSEGNFFSGYETFFSSGVINNSQGNIINMYDLIIGQGNVTGTNSIINITFKATKYGLSNISLYDVGVTNETMYLPCNVTNSSIFIYSPYDMNADKIVNLLDLIDVALHYGETGVPGWIIEDINKDGKIRVFDLVLVALHWGSY